MDFLEIGMKLATMYIPFLLALSFHEFAHGWMARRHGDNTAEMMGRLTMNPVAHMDILGTVVLPVAAIVFGSHIFFGWAKPVPVNERNLKNPRKSMFWIAVAGPLSNVLLAVLATVGIFIVGRYFSLSHYAQALVSILTSFILINLFLAVFNVLPIHPLDGGKMLARFLPESINRKLEDNEHISGMILMFLIFSGALGILAIPVRLGATALYNAATWGMLY